MKLLLDDRYAPITEAIGFLEADCARAAEAFFRWEQEIFKNSWVTAIERRTVPGPLSNALEALLPLTQVVSMRFLFVPTASRWTAFFDNGHMGTDPTGPMSVLAQRLGCRGMRIAAVPDSKGRGDKPRSGRYGALIFEVFGPEMLDTALGRNNYLRSIDLINEGKWVFEQSGTPFGFEEPETYKARRVRDRFSFELLDKYARALGVRPFDEDFYLPPAHPEATLIERVGHDPKVKERSLAEVQAEWK